MTAKLGWSLEALAHFELARVGEKTLSRTAIARHSLSAFCPHSLVSGAGTQLPGARPARTQHRYTTGQRGHPHRIERVRARLLAAA